MTRHVLKFSILAAAALTAAGCYTQLMTPQEFIQTRRQQPVPAGPDNSFSVNYHQSCVNCHSLNELNERSEELEYYGIRSVHEGVLLSTRPWIAAAPIAPAPLPGPNPYWPTSPVSGGTWWTPVGTAVLSAPADRPRTSGATRDQSTVRERPQSTNPPVYTQPNVSSGGTSSTPPASTTTTVSPAPAPASTGDGGRARDESGAATPSGRTRSDGASRDTDRPR